jgi:hypothetical protein
MKEGKMFAHEQLLSRPGRVIGWQVSGQNVACGAHYIPDRVQVVKAI